MIRKLRYFLAQRFMRRSSNWTISFSKKGYIRKDIATVVDRNADITAGRYVTLLGTYKPGLDTQYSQRLGVEMLAIPMGEAYIKASSGSETMTAINVNSKHPEEAMKLLNLVYTDKEIYNELLYGIEDVHYTKKLVITV